MLFSPNMCVFLFITFLSIVGLIGTFQKDKESQVFLIVANLLFILYGLYMAYIEKISNRYSLIKLEYI